MVLCAVLLKFYWSPLPPKKKLHEYRTIKLIPVIFQPSDGQAGVKYDPKQELMQDLRAVYNFLCDIFIFLYPGYTQHILKFWKKFIGNFF